MTIEDLWKPDEVLGRPIRVGEWLYDGRISLAVRLFKSDTRWGSGDYEDPPEVSDDQVAGDERFGSWCGFLTLDDVERFGHEQLGNSLRWHD